MTQDIIHAPLNVQIDVWVSVLDDKALRSFVAKRYGEIGSHTPHLLEGAHPATMPIEVAVAEALIDSSCNPSPEVYGIAHASKEYHALPAQPGQVHLRQQIMVLDEVWLWRFALHQYRRWWFGEMADEKPLEELTLANAVLEAVILSNANPMPNDYGIEIDRFAACQRTGRARSYQEIVPLLTTEVDTMCGAMWGE